MLVGVIGSVPRETNVFGEEGEDGEEGREGSAGGDFGEEIVPVERSFVVFRVGGGEELGVGVGSLGSEVAEVALEFLG